MINDDTFWQILPEVLENISDAEFVAIDLEMTGLASQERGRPASHLPATRQSAYADAKSSADSYNMIQLGLTCVTYDQGWHRYVLKPYTFGVSPICRSLGGEQWLERLVKRRVGFTQASKKFLETNRIFLTSALAFGINYMNEAEWTAAKKHIADLGSPEPQGDVDISTQPPITQAFYSRVRKQITDFLANPIEYWFLIENPGRRHHLNRFQKMLVFQLINAEFPGRLVVRGLPHAVEIEKKGNYQGSGTEKMQPSQVDDYNNQMYQQAGLRFLFQALRGAEFVDEPLAKLVSSSSDPEVTTACLDRLKTIEAKLKANRPVFVGHNLLTDLAFLHKTFVGELPEKVESFCELVRRDFPRILDTKFMNAIVDNPMEPDSSLASLFNCIEFTTLPQIRTRTTWDSAKSLKAHDAGYDSWLTAVVLIKTAQSPLRSDVVAESEDGTERWDTVWYRVNYGDVPLGAPPDSEPQPEREGGPRARLPAWDSAMWTPHWGKTRAAFGVVVDFLDEGAEPDGAHDSAADLSDDKVWSSANEGMVG